MQNEKQKRFKIKAVHPGDSYHAIAGLLVGKEIESMKEAPKPNFVPEGFFGGSIKLKEKVSIFRKRSRDFYFYAVELEEIKDEHVSS